MCNTDNDLIPGWLIEEKAVAKYLTHGINKHEQRVLGLLVEVAL